MQKLFWIYSFAFVYIFSSCKQKVAPVPSVLMTETVLMESPQAVQPLPDAASILSRPEIPVLCYHQIRDWRGNESRGVKDMVVPPDHFKKQLQILADSGYHTILPDELYAYLTSGKQLPPKSFMLTFDDSDLDQYKIALPEMKKHGFKGVFFIMTVSLGRSIYMSKEQVKELSDDGQVIGLHTWDHQDVRKYKDGDWEKQIVQPKKELEALIGKPVQYFAYPFGAWNKEAIPELKKYDVKAAFQLSTKRDSTEPLYTIRRMIIPGDWNAGTMYRIMKKTFKG